MIQQATIDASKTSDALFDRYAEHVNPTFIKLLSVLGYGREYIRAKDVWLWDSKQRRYLDMLAGFGAVNLGHNHPEILNAIADVLKGDAVHFNHIAPSRQQAELAELLTTLLPTTLQLCLFSNGGAEAVEAAMKLARAATQRSGFAYCRNAFHGTSFGALSIMGQTRMRESLEPLLPNCHRVDFNDLQQLETVLARKDIAAFIVEPIQGEGGLILPATDYLKQAQALCHKYQTLFVLDEIQTGLGRTGRLFAFEEEGVIPDVLIIGKSLSGGIAPIAVTVTSQTIYNKAFSGLDRFDLHSSTFAGNTLACTVAHRTLQLLQQQTLIRNSRERGEQLLAGLRKVLANHPLIIDIRGRGLYVAIEFGPTETGILNKLVPSLISLTSEKVYGHWIALKLLEAGIICQPAANHWNVLKLMPPLSISAEDIENAIVTIADVVNDYTNISKLIKDVSLRLVKPNKRKLMV